MLVVINFSLYDYHKYGYYGTSGEYSLILNSDDVKYGGRGIDVEQNLSVGSDGYIEITIPASSVQYYYAPKAKKVKGK